MVQKGKKKASGSKPGTNRKYLTPEAKKATREKLKKKAEARKNSPRVKYIKALKGEEIQGFDLTDMWKELKSAVDRLADEIPRYQRGFVAAGKNSSVCLKFIHAKSREMSVILDRERKEIRDKEIAAGLIKGDQPRTREEFNEFLKTLREKKEQKEQEDESEEADQVV